MWGDIGRYRQPRAWEERHPPHAPVCAQLGPDRAQDEEQRHAHVHAAQQRGVVARRARARPDQVGDRPAREHAALVDEHRRGVAARRLVVREHGDLDIPGEGEG